MKYLIELRPKALKDLRSLDPEISKRILKKIREMENDLVGDVKKLENFDPAYRLRVGEYRVLFDVVSNHIEIYRIRHRREVYKR
jgi:mRNA interferase RelE/StbE